jgi:hypothetical protein
MDLNAYCDNMTSELRDLKGRIDGVMARFDETSCADKSKVFPYFNQLHIMAEELNDRIETLKTECPTEWNPEKAELERRFGHYSRAWEGVWENVSPGEIGG